MTIANREYLIIRKAALHLIPGIPDPYVQLYKYIPFIRSNSIWAYLARRNNRPPVQDLQSFLRSYHIMLSECSVQCIIPRYHVYLYLFCILGALVLAGFSLVG